MCIVLLVHWKVTDAVVPQKSVGAVLSSVVTKKRGFALFNIYPNVKDAWWFVVTYGYV